MPSYSNFSQKSRKIKEGSYDNFDSPFSYDPIKEENIDVDAWVEFISYYRYYVDEFATDILGVKLYPFQRLILRAMAKYQNSMLICSRGLGKSWLSALFFICIAILYPGIKLGIASGRGQQARNVIIQKIKGELVKNDNIAREILFPIKTGQDDCVVHFKNGSEIRAIVLGQNQSGDSARSWRFHQILIDEARLVRDSVIEEVLIPMTKTKRPAAIEHNQSEKGKVIFISSAYLKSSDLYKRFLYHYQKMVEGSDDYYVCTLPYQVGVDAGIFDEEDILKEKEKPTMTLDKFQYEYEAIFVGSSNESYYPYELTEKCRVLNKCELQQPKKSMVEYIISHDVALASSRDADNACTTVIKLKQKPNGVYIKEVVLIKIHRGATLSEQRDYIRELLINFPNTIKIVIDVRGNGQALPSLFDEVWEYKNSKGEIVEYPPIVPDDDEERLKLKNAIPLIKRINATHILNNSMYTYMKKCFEDRTIKLLVPAAEVDMAYKNNEISFEEYLNYINTDLLIQELSNIKQTESGHGNTIYEKINKSTKRDRVTSLGYGLEYIRQLEEENKLKVKIDQSDYMFFLSAGF